jgi:hypothetical protein
MADNPLSFKNLEELMKNSLIPSADKLKDKIYEVDNAAFEVNKTFGLAGEQIMAIKSSLTGAVSQVERLGGSMMDVKNIISGIGDELGRSLIIESDAIADLYAASEISGKSTRSLTSTFKSAGFSMYNVAKEIEGISNSSRSMGLNTVKVTEKITDNIGQLNRFNFKGGIDGLSRMAAESTNLRVDMKTAMDLADKAFSPEGAIEISTAFQRLGATIPGLTDVNELMFNARNNPERLQEDLAEYGKQFAKMNENGDFEIMPGAKARLREINSQLNLGSGTMQKYALGAAEFDYKMSRIRMPNFDVSEEDKKLIANMSELKPGGSATIKFEDAEGKSQTKNVVELTESDVKAIKDSAAPKEIQDVQKLQLSTQESIDASLKSLLNKTASGIAGAKTSNDILEGAELVETTIYDTFSTALGKTEKISENVDKVTDTLVNSVEKLVTGEMELTEVLGNIGRVGTEVSEDFTSNFKPAMKVITDNIEEFKTGTNKFNGVLEALTGFIETVGNNSQVEKTPEVNAQDFIKTPGMGIQTLPQDTIFGGTGFESFIDGIKEMKSIPTSNNTDNTQLQDFITQMKSMKSSMNSGDDNKTPVETKTTADINLNIKIDAPNQIDTNQVVLALENQGVREKLYETMRETMYNNGLSAPTSSKTKLMNPYITS